MVVGHAPRQQVRREAVAGLQAREGRGRRQRAQTRGPVGRHADRCPVHHLLEHGLHGGAVGVRLEEGGVAVGGGRGVDVPDHAEEVLPDEGDEEFELGGSGVQFVGAAEEDLVGAAGGVVVAAEGWVEQAARGGGVGREEGEGGGAVCDGDRGCLGEDDGQSERSGDDGWEDHRGGDGSYSSIPDRFPNTWFWEVCSDYFIEKKGRLSPLASRMYIFIRREKKRGGSGKTFEYVKPSAKEKGRGKKARMG